MADKAQESTRLDFNAVYLDTNVLTASNWPVPSVKLANLLNLAVWLEVSVFLPQPVEREAEEHWLRKVLECSESLATAARDFERIARRVGGRVEYKHDNADELLAEYRKKADVAKTEFTILAIPPTTRPLSEFFDLAVRYVLPFKQDQEGKGFQDAVILASVLEHLASTEGLAGALVTGDSSFPKVDVAQFLSMFSGVTLKIVKFDEVYNLLYDTFVDVHIKEPWEEERANAKQAVDAVKTELRNFIESNMDGSIVSGGLESLGSKVLEIRAVEDVEVFYVLTPMPEPSKPERSVRIDIAVNVKYRALVQRRTPTLEALLGLASGAPPPRPQEREETLSWAGGIQATADVRDRKYSDIKFLSLIPIEQLGESTWIEPEPAGDDS